jgi:hypothetical protein
MHITCGVFGKRDFRRESWWPPTYVGTRRQCGDVEGFMDRPRLCENMSIVVARVVVVVCESTDVDAARCGSADYLIQ